MNSDIIFKYFPELTAEQKSQYEALYDLYQDWNRQINVISRKDIDELYVRHILHSLGIAKVMSFKPGTAVLDVGTGGGFPGIPLAIMFPETRFTLVDSIGKKIKVVNGVSQSIGLQNVEAFHSRAEQLADNYDFVVSRAVTRLKPFYQWVKNKFKTDSFNDLKNGILYLKGGDLSEELKEAKKKYEIYDLPNYFEEEFFETKKVVYVPVV
ncbi:16S rRNA (guanine(527)-N(7))-methyltransferase RsmG [Fulvivirga maritima]|uniref:16S rRNA (guanine(527)-N(7))-methyltransferase RsmG n=1 Tax=Fulvivirga maritima TaxID=2904247 RepID=UPI001F2AA3D5|nr:16S rRNA (guanine(527)-N(7))-methyltransferase RsmG [Fulvivirga maritima]UII26517.1 16S rRNA (guanine(527)-N(7))-methyltransferase RsmG [Fulvivirga maritima]